MNKIAVITDGKDAVLNDVLGKLTDIEFYCTADTKIPQSCSCVVISQEFTDRKLPQVIAELKNKTVGICVATKDSSYDNIEDICSLGADEIILLPAPETILRKRLASLVNKISLTDFSSLDKVAEANKGLGAFIVDDSDFKNIYKFVLRILERLDQKAQLIRFELTSRTGIVEPEVMNSFVSVVQRCLRRGDISCHNGTQIFVILLGADSEGGKIVAKRLMESFWSICDDDAYDISYEMKDINNR